MWGDSTAFTLSIWGCWNDSCDIVCGVCTGIEIVCVNGTVTLLQIGTSLLQAWTAFWRWIGCTTFHHDTITTIFTLFFSKRGCGIGFVCAGPITIIVFFFIAYSASVHGHISSHSRHRFLMITLYFTPGFIAKLTLFQRLEAGCNKKDYNNSSSSNKNHYIITTAEEAVERAKLQKISIQNKN